MSTPKPSRSSRQVACAARFLIVDDDAVLLRTWRRVLRHRRPQWEVYTAESAAAAMYQLGIRPYDVVVADLDMPETNGLDMLRAIRDRWPHIVRMLYSGFANGLDDDSVTHLYHLVLDKSATTEEFIAALEWCLAYTPAKSTGVVG